MGNVLSGLIKREFSIPVHPVLRDVSAVFTAKNKQVYLVGGAVRDSIRGYRPQDWDLATDAVPEEVIAMFGESTPRGHVIPTGIAHGTVTVRFKGHAMEVTTFRSESGYSDGRHPDKVQFGTSIEADLSRRDFTMNAAAYRLPDGPLVDPYNGRTDIAERRIICVGNAADRFAEDGLRPLRAIRFASQLDFTPDASVLAAIPGALAVCGHVAAERIRDELDRIIASPKPSAGFLLMENTGMLALLLPELAQCRGAEQKGFHQFDVLDHSLLALDYAAKIKAGPELRLAVLFHDLGKPLVSRIGEAGVRTFYNHEKESSVLARRILLRFKYPNAVIDKVCHLVEEHMFHYEPCWSDAAVRRFIIRAGEQYLGELYSLRMADSFGLAGIEPPADALLPLIERVDKILAEKKALSLKDLAVTGNDLAAAGIAPGKRMGIILGELMDTVVDDPELNTKEKLLGIALNLFNRG
ncbi:MAG: CCA tRNA nucleotidyltransferase [Treponema sp.]|nr:CCA tRNA nucleotidyltransferase [Treponema sp.]